MPLVRLLFPPDPGALRLLAALRATLAGVLTFLLVLLLGSIVSMPVTDRILGFAIALFIAANVRDGTPLARVVTIAWTPVFAFAAAALASVLTDEPLIAAALLPLIMFAVTYGATRGPRWATLGIVALIAYFLGLVTRAPVPTLPIRAVVLLFAAGDAALIHCVLLPERPQAELDRLRRAVHAGIIRVLDRITAAVTAGAWTDRTQEALNRDVHSLADVVMLAQARLTALAPPHGGDWLHLLAVEVATERVARVAQMGLGALDDRKGVLAALTAVKGGAVLPEVQSGPPLIGALVLLAHAMHEAPRAETLVPAAAPPASVAPGLRSGVQAAIATSLAIVAGDLVSPNRWYWAAFAAFVMFQGTRSRGESLAKGAKFAVGTLAGVVVGMLLATLLSGHEVLILMTIIAAVFLAFQANVAAYGAMIFWITIILGLMFGMLGFFPPELLLLRLKETAVGAICGALVASLVLVQRDRSALGDAMHRFLLALRQCVDHAAGVLVGGPPVPDLAGCVITAEQRLLDLAAMTRAEGFGLVATRNAPQRRRLLVLEAVHVKIVAARIS